MMDCVPLTLPPTIARSRARLHHARPHFCVTPWRTRVEHIRRGHAIMPINRRHLIGASAAGVAGALVMPSDAARASTLTSALGRDATQYGVRPGSRAVIATANRFGYDAALDLLDAGIEVAAIVDLRKSTDDSDRAAAKARGIRIVPNTTLVAAKGRRHSAASRW